MTKNLRVLIADDSVDDASFVLRELRRGGYVVDHRHVQSRADMAHALSSSTFDVVLCDYSMGGFDAPQALELARELGYSGPFIVVSGTIGEELAVECMRAGAHDLILKDRAARLIPAVERELVAHARRQEQERTRVQLARAEDALLRSEKLRIIGQMTAGVSHDLRNLLHPISLYVDLIEGAARDQNGQELSECIAELRHVLARGLELVERMRQFSRPPTPSQLESVSLDDVAREALAVVRPRVLSHESSVRLREELTSPPALRASAGELVSAVVNLLTNAIDAGAESVTVRTGSTSSTHWVEVTDDGPGMSSEVRAHVFEPFFTTKGEQGTGLGLAMVHAAALRYDGVVELDSAPGQGTRVRLVFPVARESARPAAE